MLNILAGENFMHISKGKTQMKIKFEIFKP